MSRADDAFPSVLAALKADASTEFGEPGAKVELLGRIDGPFSTVQRVRIQTPARSVNAYAKILKPYHDSPEELARADRMLRREYTATHALYQALRQDGEIGAVRPIAFLPEHRAIVTEEVPGRPMSEFLADPSRSAEESLAVARRVGAWLRIYQSLGESTGTVQLSERRSYLDDRLTQMEGRVLPPAERQEVLVLFDALASRLPAEVPAVPIHADLTPMNIIVDATGRIAVLDFTMAKTGTAQHDISHVYFHLEMWGARQRKPEMMRELQRALLAGYSPALSSADALFQLMLLQHVVCHAALLGARRVPIVDVFYRWFVRRRWRACRRLIQAPAPERRAA
jgi:Ser/Thr protein kinase RdoA (MazF antagonist)